MLQVYNIIIKLSVYITSFLLVLEIITYIIEPLRWIYYTVFRVNPLKENQDKLMLYTMLKLIVATSLFIVLDLPNVRVYILSLLSKWI